MHSKTILFLPETETLHPAHSPASNVLPSMGWDKSVGIGARFADWTINDCGFDLRQGQGRAIAQAVSRWLPTAAVRGSGPGLSCEILWWTKWRWGRFSRSTSVPLPIFIPPIAPKIIIYHRGLYNRQYQGLRYLGTQSHPTNNKKIIR
jgi:hypothetical protein